ncbi:LysE family translocator [Streptomyces sp. YC504]|uniref:LysE family translocator n=1 Tax=Streptomyces mesophilus TaxID=1775132 RepID=A0A6G4XJ47_9ACTN|nr:LysE family translocator [Streptomyces mesophilus]NGO77438.1 LysE family translocator [Streptomyces mesophilus]
MTVLDASRQVFAVQGVQQSLSAGEGLPSLGQLAGFAATAFALILLPGPNLVFVLTRSAAQGRRAGLVCAAGVEAATLVHIGAAALGVSALIAHSEAAFLAVKYAGVAYLLYLGLRALRSPAAAGLGADAVPQPLPRLFLEGMVVNLLNPKVALFFLAFLPQFVAPGPAARTQMLVLGTAFFAIALLLDAVYALAGGAIGGWLRRRPRILERQHLAVGGVHVALGLFAAFA